MKSTLQEAVAFFKNRQAYHKLFTLFKEKYQSLGRIGGTVPVGDFKRDEREVLGGFFGIPGGQIQANGSIALKSFEQQLENTRFQGIELKDLLDAYFGQTIISNKQHQQNRDETLKKLLLKQRLTHPVLRKWINYLLDVRGDGRFILRMAEQHAVYFETVVGVIAEALMNLPTKAEKLPMFSQRITGDPHAFDLNQDVGKIFMHVLTVNQWNSETDALLVVPTATEKVNELLNAYHIYREDILNFVTVAGLMAETESGIAGVFEAAVKENAVQIVPLRELVPLHRIYPAQGKDVYIVENSGVCSVLLDQHPSATIVCTNGQFTLASLILLDLLIEEDCMLYYAGDFDPEGLSMAQRLLTRYPGHLKLWHMDKKAYHASNPVKTLSKQRLNKLKGIYHDQLIDIANDMKVQGKAGYQEALIDTMVNDLKEKG